MADRYISEEDVYAAMEADVVRSVLARAGLSLTAIIERATALIQSYLRNSGYVLPAAISPAAYVVDSQMTDVTVRLAVLSGVRRQLCSLPSSSLQLPEDYGSHDETVARLGILNGDVTLSLTLNVIQAVGGAKFTVSTAGSGREPRSGRCMLKGY